MAGQPLSGGKQRATLLLTAEGQDVVIWLALAGDPRALLMLAGVEAGTDMLGCLSVRGLRPGQGAPSLSQPLAAQLLALGSKPRRTIWQLVHSRIL